MAYNDEDLKRLILASQPNRGAELGKAVAMGLSGQSYQPPKNDLAQLLIDTRLSQQTSKNKSLFKDSAGAVYEYDKNTGEKRLIQPAVSPIVPEGFIQESINIGGQTFKRKPTQQEMIDSEKLKIQAQQEKEDVKQISKARKDFDQYSSDAMQSLIAINKIEKEAKNLGDFPRGMLGQTLSKANMAIKGFSKDKDVTRFMGVVAQELIPAARKIMEEKGPITEFDVARVERGLGDITTPLEDKIYLLDQLRNKIREAIFNKLQVANITPEEFKTKYGNLYNASKTDGLGKAPTVQLERVSIISPSGVSGTIPSNQLNEALKLGYRRQ